MKRHVLSFAALLLAAGSAEAQYTGYSLRTNQAGAQELVSYSLSNPSVVTVVGLTGQSLRGIDFRPADGRLYGYDGSQIFTLSTTSGAAAFFSDVGDIGSTAVGVDFNPVPNALRLVGTDGSNLRITGAGLTTTVVDGTLNAALAAVAYTNSDTDPSTGTTIYGINTSTGMLMTAADPNSGQYTNVGSLGITGNLAESVGFDIVTVGGVNTAFLQVGMGNNGVSRLYTVNLASGAATLIGASGSSQQLNGLAVASTVPEPGTWALMATGLVGLAGAARRRRRA